MPIEPEKKNSVENPSQTLTCLVLHTKLSQTFALYERLMITDISR